MQTVEKFISEKNITQALYECEKQKMYFTGSILGRIYKNEEDIVYHDLMEKLSEGVRKNDGEKKLRKKINIKLLCNWCSPKDIRERWDKMSQGEYTWNNIHLVENDTPDFYVVINSTDYKVDPNKTILFRCEPHMKKHPELWGDWLNDQKFLKVIYHEEYDEKDVRDHLPSENGYYNNVDWHISKTYTELTLKSIPPKTRVFSTVLSDKYHDPGHMRRIDFVRFLNNKMSIDVFGKKGMFCAKNYKGELPPYQKDDALIPYKYTFNAENHEIPNYFTEKLIDGILAECLTFYSGCPNVAKFFSKNGLFRLDEELPFVQLSLRNFERDTAIISQAISEDWHTKRLPIIRNAKQLFLNKMQFFPRLDSIIQNIRINSKHLYIQLFNGLCNRLLPLMSLVGQFPERKIFVQWDAKSGRSCIPYLGEPKIRLFDLFERIENVTILDDLSFFDKITSGEICDMENNIILSEDYTTENDTVITNALNIITVNEQPGLNTLIRDDINLDHPFWVKLQKYFTNLIPIESLRKRIDAISPKLQNAIGIHLRRTDGGFLSNYSKVDVLIINKVNEWRKNGYTIFLSTDDVKYEKLFGDKVVKYSPKENLTKYENSDRGIYHSVVDLYLLSKCRIIISTATSDGLGSTFGLVACLLQKSMINANSLVYLSPNYSDAVKRLENIGL